MKHAVDAAIKNKMGYKKANTSYSVPRATLQRYVKKKLQNESAVVDKSVGKIRPVFTAGQDLEIVSQLIEMQRRLFGVTMKELRQFVFQLAVKITANIHLKQKRKWQARTGHIILCNGILR